MTDREPKIGDVIRTATPLQTDTLTHRAGQYLELKLPNQTCVEAARELVASGRWVIVDPQPQEEPGPAADTATKTREGEL